MCPPSSSRYSRPSLTIILQKIVARGAGGGGCGVSVGGGGDGAGD